MSASQRNKGARGELEVVELLKANAWPRAHRNFGSGSAGGGDIARGPEGTSIESKRHGGRLDLPRAMRQAEEGAAETDVPIVAHRRDGERWLATLPLGDLLELLAWREQG